MVKKQRLWHSVGGRCVARAGVPQCRNAASLEEAAHLCSSIADRLSAIRRRDECREVAGSSLREPPRDSLLRDTLLTLIAPDSMKTAPAKARILDAKLELPTTTVVRSSQATPARRRGQLCA